MNGLPAESLALATEDCGIYVAITKDGVQIKGDVKISGNISVKGDVDTDGKIAATGDILAESNVSGAHHTHPGDSGGQPN